MKRNLLLILACLFVVGTSIQAQVVKSAVPNTNKKLLTLTEDDYLEIRLKGNIVNELFLPSQREKPEGYSNNAEPKFTDVDKFISKCKNWIAALEEDIFNTSYGKHLQLIKQSCLEIYRKQQYGERSGLEQQEQDNILQYQYAKQYFLSDKEARCR